MTINIKNFLNDKTKLSKMGEFQSLKQIEGLEMSSISLIYTKMVEMIWPYSILQKEPIMQHLQLQTVLHLNSFHGIIALIKKLSKDF